MAIGVPVRKAHRFVSSRWLVSHPNNVMKYSLEFKGSEPNKSVRQLIDDLIRRVEKKTKGFSPDEVFLRVLVEWNPAGKLDNISITLEMPGKTLAAKEERRDLEAALREAFAEIQRQLENHKAALRGEHLWKRLPRREQLRNRKIEGLPSEQRDFQPFFQLVSPYLDRLNEFVRHVMAFAEARGDLARDEVSQEDIVDATLLRAFREFVKNPAQGNIGSWLIRLATEELGAEIERSITERELTVSIEQDIPEVPPTEEVSRLGEDILYFYQPDEDLKLEDVVPDIEVPTPEEETLRNELRQCVRSALKTMPGEWRRVLLLRYVRRLSSAEIARTLEKAQPEIDGILEHARQCLRQNLIELGCASRQTAESDAGGPIIAECRGR